MAQIDQHAVELRAAPARRYAFQRCQQLIEVLPIVGVFTGIACGVDARRAAQRVYRRRSRRRSPAGR